MKRKLNVINQNNILKCEIRLKRYPEQSLQNYHYLAKLTVWDIHLKLKYAVYEQVFRQEFGISQSGQFVRNIVRIYIVCRKLHANTAWKVSGFGIFLVFIFPHSDWIRKDTVNSVRMRENKKQKNSEYGHFSHNTSLTVTQNHLH